MSKSNPVDGAYWSPKGHMKRVLYVSAGQDVGGQGYRLKRAFDHYGEAFGYEMRSMHMSDTYIQYPHDLRLDDFTLAAKLYREADIVQHCGSLYLYAVLDDFQCKPTVLHSHGCRLRDNAQDVVAEGASVNATMVVSTVDLLQDAPSAHWVPQCVDVPSFSRFVRYRLPGDRLRVGHAPTVRGVKGTDEILAALSRLAHKVEVDLIEGVTWRECLERKARCDIFIDQLTLGYGINGLEAMAMAIPVVSGFDDPLDRKNLVQKIGLLPFVDTTCKGIDEALTSVVEDEGLRVRTVQTGWDFLHEYHDERAVVARLAKIYDSVPRSAGEVRLGADAHNRQLDLMHTVRRAGFRVEVFA